MNFHYQMKQEEIDFIASKLESLNEFQLEFVQSLEKYNFRLISEKQFSVLEGILKKLGYTGKIEKPEWDPEWLTKRLDSIEMKITKLSQGLIELSKIIISQKK